MKNLINCFAGCKLIVFVFLTAGIIFGQDKADQMAPNKEKISYLQHILEGLPEGVEKDFFLELKKYESSQRDLIQALKLFKEKNLIQFGTIQLQGQKIQPLYIDWGASWVMTYRPKLFWETTVITSKDSFRLLFFQPKAGYDFHPTSDGLVLITDTNFKIRLWTKVGCYQNFIKASLEKAEDGFIFKVISNIFFENKLRFHEYKITSNKIEFLKVGQIKSDKS